jgi:hypothetical protein
LSADFCTKICSEFACKNVSVNFSAAKEFRKIGPWPDPSDGAVDHSRFPVPVAPLPIRLTGRGHVESFGLPVTAVARVLVVVVPRTERGPR